MGATMMARGATGTAGGGRALLLLAILAGCETGSPAAQLDQAVSDSAGISIVELGTLVGLPRWGLSGAPSVDIGTVDGPVDQQLFGVRGGARLSDGRIAVLNGGTQELRIYAPSGDFAASQGGPGDGPGEYRGPAALFRFGPDSLVVWDAQLRRVTYLGPDGRFSRTLSLEGSALIPEIGGVFADGSFLVADNLLSDGAEGEYDQLMSRYVRYDPQGRPADSLGTFPWMIMRTFSNSSGGIEAVRMTFDGPTDRAVHGDQLWVGTAKAYTVERRSGDGRLTTIVRWAGADRRVTEADKEALRQERLAGVDDPEIRRRIETSLDLLAYAEDFPAYANLVPDPDGNVWVGEYLRPGHQGPQSWWVFDPNGTPLRTVELPRNTVLWVSAQEVGLLERDELDVEHLRVYALAPL